METNSLKRENKSSLAQVKKQSKKNFFVCFPSRKFNGLQTNLIFQFKYLSDFICLILELILLIKYLRNLIWFEINNFEGFLRIKTNIKIPRNRTCEISETELTESNNPYIPTL